MKSKPYYDWSLDKWLLTLEDRYPIEVMLRLVNASLVAKRLKLLTKQTPVITVAGTNGKGSTVAALEAIYCAAGYRVGSYTSPHLLHFNERIRVNRTPIRDECLCAAFVAIEEARGDTPLSYFEMATLASLLYFKEQAVEVVILEVGLGGRLDATNIIDADLAIITTVALDHQDFLGHTIEAIGYEKAGILRKNIPFIYADESLPKSVRLRAQSLHNKMYCFDVNYSVTVEKNQLKWVVEDAPPLYLPVPNIHLKSAAAALLASQLLSDRLPVSSTHWRMAMQDVEILGRKQLIDGPIKILYDVAHNPQAVSILSDFIKKYSPKGAIHAIFSGLKDKDLCGIIRPLRSEVTYWYPALLSGKRAASEKALLEALKQETGNIPVCFSNPKEAYDAAFSASQLGDLIVVYGSFLLVSAVMVIQSEGNV